MAIWTATALFDGTQDSVHLTFSGLTTNPPKIFGGAPVVTDGSSVVITLANPTNTGVDVNASGRFNGSVTLIGMD